MKKTFFSFFAALLFFSAQAQLTKGNWVVGGSGSFYSSKSTFSSPSFSQHSEGFDLNISPNVGYFIVDKFVVGLSPSFSWGKFEDNGGGNSNIKRFLIGPFAKYYFLNTDKPFNILLAASYQHGVYSFKPTTGNSSTFLVAAGPVIYLNSSVGLEFTLGYASKVDDIKNNYKTTQKGFQMGIGFQIHLEKE